LTPTAALSAGAVLGLSAGAAPGPLTALVLSLSLRHGAAQGARAALAPLVTDAPIVAAAVLAVFTLAGAGPLLGVLSICGGLFVAWLGVKSASWAGEGSVEQRAPASLRQAIGANFLNPNPYVFWFTVGGPLVVRAWHENPTGAALFLAGFYFCLVGLKLAMALLASKSRSFVSGRGRIWMVRAMGGALFAFAALLLYDGITRLLSG